MTRRAGLIAVSGVDGSGKSTLAAGLVGALRASGRDAVTVAALKPPPPGLPAWIPAVELPESTRGAREQWIAGFFTLALLHNALNRIEPALDAGTWVVADRWELDHLANQHALGADMSEWLPWLRCLPRPTCHLLLDVPTRIAAARVRDRGDYGGVGTGEVFLRRCAARMRSLARSEHPEVIHILDGSLDPQVILHHALAVISQEPAYAHG